MRIELPEFLKEDYLSNVEVLEKSKYFVGLTLKDDTAEIINADEYRMFTEYGSKVGDDVLITTKSLVWLFNLIERGKQYNVFLKPSNFMVNRAGQAMGIFRKVPTDSTEILDMEWLNQVKKLIGMSLIQDKSKVSGKENLVSLAALIEDDRMREGFIRVMDLPDLGSMTRELVETFWPMDVRKYLTIYARVEKVDNRLREPIVDYSKNVDEEDEKPRKEEKVAAKTEVPKKRERPQKVQKPKKEKVKREVNIDLSEKVPLFTKIMMGVTIISLGVAGFMWNEGNKKSEVYTQMMREVRYNEDFYSGILNAATNEYTKADKDFEAFQKNNAKMVSNLAEDEKYVLMYTYVYVGEYQQALDVYKTEDAAEIVVRYLRAQNMIGEVAKLESDTNVIKFEKAVLEGNNEDIIKYGNKVDIESETVRDRVVMIAKAYVNSGDLDGAIAFATNNPTEGLLESIKEWDYKYIESVEKDKKKQTERKIEDGNKIDALLK